jgi:hypothetical protein
LEQKKEENKEYYDRNKRTKEAGIKIAREAQGKNSGPASKARYFVLSAFAHERGILIGCLQLDYIIRSLIHHKGSG